MEFVTSTARRRRREPDWTGWLARWDEQQESFNSERERRFSVMFDVAEAVLGRRFRALDLGCGPGSLSARLLRRFPATRVVAVDDDPVALTVGQGALGATGRRLQWVDARLGSRGWTARLPRGRFDAAFSTTALHWLQPPDLRRLYMDLGRLLRAGGIFLNGDRIASGPRERSMAHLAERVRRVRFRGRSLTSEWAAWHRWWREAAKVPELRAAFEERERRRGGHPTDGDTPLETQVRFLHQGGFADVRVVWQDLENRILFARRGAGAAVSYAPVRSAEAS